MNSFRIMLAFIVSMFLSTAAAPQGMCVNPTDGPRLVYDDGVEPGWEIWNWGNPAIIPSTIAGKSGNTALRITFPNTTGGGIQIQATGYPAGLSTSGASALTFMLRKEMLGAVSVGVVNGSNTVPVFVTADQPYVVPTNYNVNPAYNSWIIFSIPLSALQASNTTLGGVVFATSVPGTFYLDKIEFTEGFLSFPLDCSNATCSGTGVVDYRVKSAYTINSVTSVHDHSMKLNPNGWYPYGTDSSALNGIVHTWTGEVTVTSTPVQQGCYAKLGGGTFNILGTYISGDGCTTSYLNYDDHPGYDYKAILGTPVKAGASGTVVDITGERCYKNNFSSCNGMGAVGIDHGNGYITQYLHMTITGANAIKVNAGQVVTQGQVIGYADNTGLSATAGPHLHFEVLKKLPGLTPGTYMYKMVDPYGWYADGQDDPLIGITGVRSSLLWKP